MGNTFELGTSQQIFEFRGVDKFYFAEVTQDDADGYVTGTPVHIPVQEIGKSTDSASEAHYYDNKAMIVVNSESADTITLTIAPPSLDKLAQLIGKSFDATTGMLVDSPRQNKYYAIMYRTKGTDGGYRYVSRLKGQFNIPEETFQTENDGTDTNNTQITFTGIYTEHEFAKGVYDGSNWSPAGVKGIVVDARYGLADVSNFFDAIQTPDSIQVNPEPHTDIPVTGVSVTPTAGSVTVGQTLTLTASVAPADATNKAVTWSSSSDSIATVSDEGVVTGVAEGDATITVTTEDGGFTATCNVTVEAATVAVTGVTVSPTSDSITVEETLTLTATVAPENATNQTVTWSSSDDSIATVEDGVVTGVAAGNATITVTTEDGGFTATCDVTVTS